MSDKLKLYKLNYSGAEINERLEKVDANFEKIAENLAAINENTAADAQFKTEVANTYAKKSDMPNMELYALKSELPVMPDLTNYALKSELPNMVDYALKSDIPEGQDLSIYATKAEIEAAGYLTAHQDLSNYALKSELPVVPELPDFEKFALKSEMPSVEGLATSEAVEAVNTKIDTVLANAPEELDTLKEIADLLETKQDAKDVVDALATKANSADVYTKAEIDGKGFITELPTIPTVPTKVSEFENDANYLTEQSLAGYATQQYVDDAVAVASTGGEINLDAYATKDYVDDNFQQKGNYLTEHQDLSGYVTSDALEQAGYITSNDVPTKVSAFENDAQYLTLATLPEYPSTEGLATTEAVEAVNTKIDTVLENAPEELDTLKEIADLLATKQDASAVVNALATKANKSEVEESFNTVNAALNDKVDSATLNDYATKTYVSEQGFLTENNLSDYVTNEDLNTAAYLTSAVASDTYQVKGNYLTEQSLTGYATETFVNEKIADVVGGAPETLDTLNEIATALNDNATVTMVSEAISTKANSADVYTKTEIDNKGYLTQHQDLSDYVTSQTLDAKLGDFVTEGSEEHWTMNGVDYEEDPTYEVSNSFDYIHDAESWQQSYENGGLALYYANNPFEDLWSEDLNRVANITDHVCEFVSYADENGETEYGTGKVQVLVNNPWDDQITYIKVKVLENSVEGFVDNEYYLEKNAKVGETLYQLYTDDALTQGTGIYVKITSETVPGFTHSWEGAINAPGAMYPWIVPHFENDVNDVNSKIIFRYEGLDDVYPWGDKVFGNGNDHKIWGCASIPNELGNEFLLTNGETSFDINKFQMVLEHQGVTHYPAVETKEYTVKEYIDMKFQQLFEMINA